MEPIIYREPLAGEIEQCLIGLQAHNAAFVTNRFEPYRRVALHPTLGLAGGIKGSIHFHKMHIDILWVLPAARGHGIGTALLTQAEDAAVRSRCTGIILDTFSFQALTFYRHLGYTVFGEVAGYEGGAVRHYLHKSLTPAAPSAPAS